MAQSVAGDSTTSSRPRRTVTAASGAERTFDSPRAAPDGERLVDERIGEAARRHALDARAERQQRHEIAGPARQRALDGGAIRTGRADQHDPRPRVEDGGLATGQLGHREEADVGEGVVVPRRPARRGSGRRRAPRRRAARIASSVSDSSLSGGDRSSGTPAASSAASASSPIESPSPTHRSIATRGPLRGARRRRRR